MKDCSIACEEGVITLINYTLALILIIQIIYIIDEQYLYSLAGPI